MQPQSLHFRISIGSFHWTTITETEISFSFQTKKRISKNIPHLHRIPNFGKSKGISIDFLGHTYRI